jgi:hypothetical protein
MRREKSRESILTVDEWEWIVNHTNRIVDFFLRFVDLDPQVTGIPKGINLTGGGGFS